MNESSVLQKLKQEFLNPPDEFSPIPFWFWNDALSETEIARQIRDFRDKGVMGFVIHPRIGLPEDIPYLSDRFLQLVRFAVSEAAQYQMKVVLYDEGMYPSGAAHGQVVQSDLEYAARGLRMREYPLNSHEQSCEIAPDLEPGETIVAVLAMEKLEGGAVKPGGEIRLLGDDSNHRMEANHRFQANHLPEGGIRFEPPEAGTWSVFVFTETFTRGTIRGIHFGEDDGEPDAPLAADLLNPEAVRQFIRLTHERYYSYLQEYFGNTIIAFFTDEPDLLGRNPKAGLIPWTPGFMEYYLEQGNNLTDLAALWLEAGSGTDAKRKKYWKAVNKRLKDSYYQPISQWCETQGITLTGHPHASDAIGLLKYFQIPGQDLVWRWVSPRSESSPRSEVGSEKDLALEGPHSTLGKCSSDSARHRGRRRNANECFGCCGPNGVHWAFSAGDMKWYLDWLFVRGVNLIYPHAFYYSLAGPRVNERPPDVGPGNIWWRYYLTIATYIKRISWLMTDVVNATPVAVLCEEDRLPWAIVKPLYQNQIEFNYLEEELLGADDCRIENGWIKVSGQRYRTLVVDDTKLITGKLVEFLRRFINGGGKLVLYDPEQIPVRMPEVFRIKEYEEIVALLEQLDSRELKLTPGNKDLRVSHLRKNGLDFYLLVNEGEGPIYGELQVKAWGMVECWNAWSGTMTNTDFQIGKEGSLQIPVHLPRRESIILVIDPSRPPESVAFHNPAETVIREVDLKDGWRISGVGPANGEAVYNGPLTSWTQWEGMQDFSGTLVYERRFELAGLDSQTEVELDLGDVGEIAHLYVNEVDAGFKLWAPYVFDITSHVQPGKNRLKIEVTNTLANRLSGAKIDSGLFGPVKLRTKEPLFLP
ncbi:MAG TPA: glycosyl hydrolase [Bacillota bacterium]|nr:glycosyl hydrolase [Bacillota bacterium]